MYSVDIPGRGYVSFRRRTSGGTRSGKNVLLVDMERSEDSFVFNKDWAADAYNRALSEHNAFTEAKDREGNPLYPHPELVEWDLAGTVIAGRKEP